MVYDPYIRDAKGKVIGKKSYSDGSQPVSRTPPAPPVKRPAALSRPDKPVWRQPTETIAEKTIREAKEKRNAGSSVTKPIKRPPSRPASPKQINSGVNTEEIKNLFTTWEDRGKGSDFWSGMSERDALNTADGVHRGVQTGRLGIEDVQEQLNMTRPEAISFSRHRGQNSKIRDFGVPHTAAGEDMFTGLMSASGNATKSLAEITGDPEVTDLISKINGQESLVDVQNIMTRGRFIDNPDMTVDFLKNLRNRNSGLGIDMFYDADDDETLRNIIRRTTSEAERRGGQFSFGYGKGLQSRNFEDLDVGRPDVNMQRNRGNYAKDYLIGGVYDTDKVENLTGSRWHGTYNPRMPEGGSYATDLNKLRDNILDLPKKDIVGLDGKILDRSPKNLSLRMPLKSIQELAGGNALQALINNPVYKAAEQFGSSPGFRAAGVGLAAIPLLGDAADAATGAVDVATKKGDAQVRGAGNLAAGTAGLTALAAPVAAPILAPVSAGLGIGNAVADMTLERRKNDPSLTRNSGAGERSGAFIHSESNPVTISGPSAVVSETQRRRNARRSTGGVQAKPATAGQWWKKALGALSL